MENIKLPISIDIHIRANAPESHEMDLDEFKRQLTESVSEWIDPERGEYMTIYVKDYRNA